MFVTFLLSQQTTPNNTKQKMNGLIDTFGDLVA